MFNVLTGTTLLQGFSYFIGVTRREFGGPCFGAYPYFVLLVRNELTLAAGLSGSPLHWDTGACARLSEPSIVLGGPKTLTEVTWRSGESDSRFRIANAVCYH